MDRRTEFPIRISRRNPARPRGLAWVYGIAAGFCLAAAAWGQSPAQGCPPDFQGLFDFRIGDVFQFRIQSNAPYRTEIIRKYAIASRAVLNQTRTYVTNAAEVVRSSNDGHDLPTTYRSYHDTLIYRDIISNPFDSCAGALVRLPEYAGVPDIRTRVEISFGDTALFPLATPGQALKSFGRALLGADSLPVSAGFEQRKAFAEGLGRVSDFYKNLSSGDTTWEYLMGYVKNGDTVGTVSPDAYFHTTGLRPFRVRSARGAAPEPGSPDRDARGRALQPIDGIRKAGLRPYHLAK